MNAGIVQDKLQLRCIREIKPDEIKRDLKDDACIGRSTFCGVNHTGIKMKVKGVNLGNWLVLEKWMSPALFEGTAAVRIPVPYFIFGDREPFIGCIKELDKAFNWAEKYGLQILIDLHTAPMGQNGFDNGGICGVCKWSKCAEEVEFVLSVLERLAARYGSRKGLWGIEALNKPITEKAWKLMDVLNRYPAADPEMAEGSGPLTLEFLKEFYSRAYDRIRKYLPEDKYMV